MKLLLRIESAALLLASLFAYHLVGGNWWLFLLLVLAPDLSMLGYLAGPRVGAWCYNAVHAFFAPVLAWLAGLAIGSPLLVQIAVILAAHIAADRMLGYGLKHQDDFKETHLGRIDG
ncbi:DUF4260 domain-containing protein [Chelativorans sp. AA-79]|uniref:DUF4260 domain-containing protein n=1 Tax=Chelativorans sp. AA-79 TaxID=3028735 RepID=UPI0023F68EA0|nr:DUF4260 domain-containing protein [Chelativorans sp. AA-79]WEX09774.1 DUF4260 domain-containing protein [Chelativorans sp. AA-79]